MQPPEVGEASALGFVRGWVKTPIAGRFAVGALNLMRDPSRKLSRRRYTENAPFWGPAVQYFQTSDTSRRHHTNSRSYWKSGMIFRRVGAVRRSVLFNSETSASST